LEYVEGCGQVGTRRKVAHENDTLEAFAVLDGQDVHVPANAILVDGDKGGLDRVVAIFEAEVRGLAALLNPIGACKASKEDVKGILQVALEIIGRESNESGSVWRCGGSVDDSRIAFFDRIPAGRKFVEEVAGLRVGCQVLSEERSWHNKKKKK
jgi:hypothetical protein